MKHLAFLYYTLAYSTGLPTLALIILAYFKTGNKIIKYYLPFYLSITLQLILVAVLRYQDVMISFPNSYPNVEAKYLYFLVESTLIFTLPFFALNICRIKYIKEGKVLFGTLFFLALMIMISPYFLKYIPSQRELISLWGFLIYRSLLIVTIIYCIILLGRHFFTLTEKTGRLLLISAGIFAFISILEILHCDLLPILKYFPITIPLSPLGYLMLNAVTLIYLTKQILLKPSTAPTQISSSVLLDRYKITEREQEIIELLIAGYKNKDICQKLYISGATVKTHIHNIYQKLGIQNRVQLVNIFKKNSQ